MAPMPTMRGTSSPVGLTPAGPLRPEDALAEFLFPDDGGKPRILQNAGPATGLMDDPNLELASLRGARQGEAQDRALMGDESAGKIAKFLGMEQAQDPVTGDAALAAANKAGKQYTDMTAEMNPGTPQGQLAWHQDAMTLAKAKAEHPDPNVSPFVGGGAAPAVPGFGPSGAGTMAGRGAAQATQAPAAMGGGAGPAGPAGLAVPAHGVRPPDGVDPQRWGQLTSDLTPDTAAKVAGVLSYSEPLPQGNAMVRPEWSVILGRAMQIDPSFSYPQYAARQKYLTDLSAGGPSSAAAKKQSLNMTMQHLDELSKNYEGLHNGEYSAVNSVGNWFKSHTAEGGFPALSGFSDAGNAVAGELSNLFKAGQASDEEIKSWRQSLSDAATPEEFAQKMHTLTALIRGRMGAMEKQYSDVMGRQAPDGLFLGPDAKAIFDRYQQPGGGGNQPLRRNVRGGGTAVSNDGGKTWTRE